MRAAYVDTSCLVAMAFNEPDADDLVRTLADYDLLLVSHLTEAELAAAHARHDASVPERFLSGLDWVAPDRRLTAEIDRVLANGYVRGADVMHLAVALYAAESPGDIAFLTLDERQREVAAALGFEVGP